MSKLSDHDNIRAKVVSSEYIQVAAVFNTAEDANRSARQLTQDSEISPSQITVIDPMDGNFDSKLERPSDSIGKMMWNAHLLLGGIGLTVGLIVAFLLVEFGPELTQQNPMFTYIALISPGIFIGIFVAGLLSLRPDRNQIVETVRHAIKTKHYALIVNLQSHQSVSAVAKSLRQRSGKVVEAIH